MVTIHMGLVSKPEASIPPDHIHVIQQVMKDALGVEVAQEIKSILGGFSSPGMYKVKAGGRFYVVRFSHGDWKKEDREREIGAMRNAAQLGLAPKLYYADADQGVVMMEYLPKQDPPAWQQMTDAYMRKLAMRMRLLHEGPALKPYVSIFDDVRAVGNSIKGDRLNFVQASLLLNDKLQTELAPLWQNKPCHNDLHPDNTIEHDGQIYFIDWEEAGPSDPFRDLVTYGIFSGMRPDKERKFLSYYLNREVTPADWVKYNQTKGVILTYYGLVMIMLSQKQGLEMPTENQIKALPPLHEVKISHYFEKGFSSDIMELAFIFLKEANREG